MNKKYRGALRGIVVWTMALSLVLQGTSLPVLVAYANEDASVTSTVTTESSGESSSSSSSSETSGESSSNSSSESGASADANVSVTTTSNEGEEEGDEEGDGPLLSLVLSLNANTSVETESSSDRESEGKNSSSSSSSSSESTASVSMSLSMSTHTGGSSNPPVVTPPLSCDELNDKSGWYGEYFNYSRTHSEMNLPSNQWGSGHEDPLDAGWTSDWYESEHYRFSRVDANLMFGEGFFPFDASAEEWDDGVSGVDHDFHFGAHWAGVAKVSVPGSYGITLTSDDDAWVYLDGVLVLDNSGVHAPTTKTATLNLTGSNRIDIYFAERHVVRSNMYFAFTKPGVTVTPTKDGCEETPKVTIVATKVVCDEEAKLPNWGLGGPDITKTSAEDYVNSHPGCRLEPNWKFQYGFGPKSGATGVLNLSGDFVGEADGSKGQGTNTGTGYSDWKTFGPTGGNGVASVEVTDLEGASKIWVREVLEDAYVPFTYYPGHATNENNVSAELYCHKDVLNYDNYDYINNPAMDATYYCVGFNALKYVEPVNEKPVITVTTPNPMDITVGTTFTDPGATASDPEDGDITANIVTTGTVNTAVVGTYTITYNVSDSKGLAADPKTRTVNVVPPPVCTAPIDAMLVIDRSGSMEGAPLVAAKAASGAFIDTMTSVDRAGVVSYSDTATLNKGLTFDLASAKTSYASISANGATNIGAGIDKADAEFSANGRGAGVKRLMLLLSDGRPNRPTNETTATTYAKAQATEAKSNGITIYTIGLGSSVNANLMKELASVPTNYFAAPTANDLEDIYTTIAEIECEREPATVSGKKWNDANGSGTVNEDETTLSGWTITLTSLDDQGVVLTTTTNQNGAYTFADVTEGSYMLCEEMQDGWRETFPNPSVSGGCYLLNIASGANITDKDFLNTELEKPACRDGKDNDGDGKVDYPEDTGCDGTEDNDENNRPVITVIPPDPATVALNSTYTDAGATASDPEDGNITANIVKTGTVDTQVIGSYTIRYNVTDSDGLAAVEKTRVVNVVAKCSDGIDNDGDQLSDYPADPGCGGPEDDDENTPPLITLLGANPLELYAGTPFTEPGYTAADPEDGNITGSVVVSGSVDTNTVGTYVLAYNVSDSKGLPAPEKLRVVKVNPPLTECNDGIDNDGDNRIDFQGHQDGDALYLPDPGCDSFEDDSENEKPVITVVGADPLTVYIGSTYTDPGRTAADHEDGNITANIVDTGTVDTNTVGTYTVYYDVTDSDGLAADQKSRVVKVVSACSDGIDNDQDGDIDFSEDAGCENGTDDSENERPVITLTGDADMTVVQGTVFTDPGATAADHEDGNITANIVTAGTVNTGTVGTYTITYNVSDSEGLAAVEKSRTVTVTPAPCTVNCGGGSTPPACSDGGDNDGDGLPDFPKDPGCDSPQDNDERDTGPVLTLLGDNPMTVTQGTTFTDPGATAQDPEEGNITSRIVTTGSVDANTLGTYTITYNVSDSQGHAAQPKTRTVNVVPGGGGGTLTLTIYNEKLESLSDTSVRVTWNTNLAATSRVVYGLDPVSNPGAAPLYGYGLTTATSTALTTTHSMTIDGIPSAATTYFRPVSSGNAQTVVGIELTRGAVLGESECFYLKEYMRLGANNNPVEVTKLQTFLRDYEGFKDLAVTGFFDITTDKAVREFQDRYKDDVLTPWKLPGNTGYVYYTTQKKVNEIYCQRPFPLSETQEKEVNEFRQLMNIFGTTGGGVPPRTSAPVTSANDGGASGVNAVVATAAGSAAAGEVAGAAIAGTPTLTVEPMPALPAAENAGEENERVALSDLLATMPGAEKKMGMMGDDKMDGMMDEEDEGEKELSAALGAMKSTMGASPVAVSVSLLLMLIALLLVIFYARAYMKAKRTEEMQIPD